MVQRLVGSEMDYFCDCKLCRQWEDEEAEWENEVDNEAADYDNAEDVGDDDASGSEDSYYSDGEYY